jgi:hypothetical protein
VEGPERLSPTKKPGYANNEGFLVSAWGCLSYQRVGLTENVGGDDRDDITNFEWATSGPNQNA